MRLTQSVRRSVPVVQAALAALLSLMGSVPSAAAPIQPRTSIQPQAQTEPATPHADEPEWQAEIVLHSGIVAKSSALAMYDDDVHLVFTEADRKAVRYAHWGGMTEDWELAEVMRVVNSLSTEEPEEVEVALDPSQQAHIVYAYDNTIYYAHPDEFGFRIEAIADGWRPTVALTEAGPVVSFIPPIYSGQNHTVAVATLTEAGWQLDAAFAGDLVRWQSLAVDQAQRVHLAVGGGAAPYDEVYHLRRSGDTWQQTYVDQGYNPAVATDFSNNAHIAYSMGNQLRYASWTGANWVTETVTTTVGTVTGDEVIAALALGLADTPHLAFVDAQGLKYATRVDGVWLTSEVYGTDASGPGEVKPFSWVDLVVDEEGLPHLSFQEGPGDIGHATLASPWRSLVVDDRAPVAHTAIDASLDGRPRISYAVQGGAQRGLNYAAFGDFGCEPFTCHTGWVNMPVALGAGADRGYYNNIVLRGVVDGEARVASYDPVAADLEYSFRVGAGWTTETVDSVGDVGRYADLELDVRGQPWIAYWDNTNFRVRLAWKDLGGWQIITNTVGPALNAESGRLALALPLPTSGLCCAYISYYDGVSDDLRVAKWDGAAWTDALIASDGDVGSLSAIDFTRSSQQPAGDLMAVFYDAGQQRVWNAQLPPALNESSYHLYSALTAVGNMVDLSELVTFNHGFGGLSFGYTTSGDNAVRVAHGVYSDWRVDTLASGGTGPRRYVALDQSNYRLNATYVGAAGELVYAISRRTLTYMGYNPLEPCVEDDEEALAQLAAAPAAFVPLTPAAAAAASDLDVLRAARDLFATDPEGQAYIALYYARAAETGLMAVADPDLAAEAFDLVQDFLPGIAALVSAEGQYVIISQELVDRTNHLADQLAAVGSPELAAAIAAERAKYDHLEAFVGLSFAEAAALMEVPVPTRVFVPLVRR